jgi:hypothetical protein
MEIFKQLQSASPYYVAALIMGNALILIIMRSVAEPFTRPKHHAASRITWKVSAPTTLPLAVEDVVKRCHYCCPKPMCFPLWWASRTEHGNLKRLMLQSQNHFLLLGRQGTFVNWALWPETLLKRKPAFRKITLEALKIAAIQNAKGPTDFGCVPFRRAGRQRRLAPKAASTALDRLAPVVRLRFFFPVNHCSL